MQTHAKKLTLAEKRLFTVKTAFWEQRSMSNGRTFQDINSPVGDKEQSI